MGIQRFCTNCGSKISEKVSYCTNCGVQVERAVQSGPDEKVSTRHRSKNKFIVIIGFIAAIVVLFILGSILLIPSKFQASVFPSDKSVIVKTGRYNIEIPAGTVQQEQKLSVSKIDGVAPAVDELEPLCPPMDVKLSGHTTFKEPIMIEIPYNKNKLKGLDPHTAFVAVYYDETAGAWMDVPYEVDETKSTVRMVMHHLTIVQLYYSLWEGAMVYDNGTVRVIYNFNTSMNKAYNTYEQAVDRTTGKKSTPQFVVDVADNATLILKAYHKAGLKIPTSPKIYITESNNSYNSATGNISIGINIATQGDPEKLMLRNLAHELFHTAQQLNMGNIDYETTRWKNNSFWMEATADYMANTGVWELLKKEPISKYEYYNLNFFKESLYKMDGGHENDAANFVAFVQKNKKATPVQLISIAESYSSFPSSFYKIYGPKANLDDYYDAFLEYSLFNNSSHFLAKNNATLLSWISNKTDFIFRLDEQGRGVLPTQWREGIGSLSFAGEYTADFYTMTTNCDTTLTIYPNSDLKLYRCSKLRSDRGWDLRMEAFADNHAIIEFGKDEYILITKSSPIAGSTNFSYRAEPMPEDLSGRWNATRFICVDIEASQAFWNMLMKKEGKSKADTIAATNDPQQRNKVHFVVTKTDEGYMYTIEMRHSSGDVATFKNVPFVNNRLQSQIKIKGLHGSIDFTVKNRQLTGTLRAEVVWFIGSDFRESAIFVFDVIAVKD